MKRTVHKFSSFRESECADRDYYLSLTPQQRIDILLELVARYREEHDETSEGFQRVFELLNSEGVRYVIVGGYAVAFDGHPRFTGDIDVFVDASVPNSRKMEQVVRKFGFSESDLSATDFVKPGAIIQLGVAPNRVDMITSIDAVEFDEAWDTRVEAAIDGVPVSFISKDLLLKNKAATGRTGDAADIERLKLGR